ncbi:MAG TPA: hypothetical protein RMH99_12510 [Sandaracinaceae bacterium LLY-WYZ-13_1]|nr:hypothetical protein [Sandaracinaceae bacterium LLY-WYZ-13_1]
MKFFLLDTSRAEVVRMGRLYADEAVEAMRLSVGFMLSQSQLTRAGFILDLTSASTTPFLDPGAKTIGGASFRIDESATREKIALDRVLATRERESSELGGRLRRSARWQRIALATEDLSARFLNLWIAAESLCDVNTARFLAGLSLPRGLYYQQVSVERQRELKRIEPLLLPWRVKLTKLLEAGREIRNLIAHEGARELEVHAKLEPGDLDLLVRALELLVPRLHRLALTAVYIGHQTVAEMWEHYGRILETTAAPGVPTTSDAEQVIASLDEANRSARRR